MDDNTNLPKAAAAERIAEWAASLDPTAIPDTAREAAGAALMDFAGLAVAARDTDYIHALMDAWDGAGDCTALGHGRGLDAAGAALLPGQFFSIRLKR